MRAVVCTWWAIALLIKMQSACIQEAHVSHTTRNASTSATEGY